MTKLQQKPPRNSPPSRPSSFKEAVVGAAVPGYPSRRPPIERSASAGLDAVLAAHPVMGWKVGNSHEMGCAMDIHSIDPFNERRGTETSNGKEGTLAAAAGLPLISFGCNFTSANQTPAPGNNNYVLDSQTGNVLVPLNLMLASQGLLPGSTDFSRAQSAPSALNPAAMDYPQHAQHGHQESGTFSTGELLTALNTQLHATLGLDNGQQHAAQHAQRTASAPFFGQYQAENQGLYVHREEPQDDPTMCSSFYTVSSTFHHPQSTTNNNISNDDGIGSSLFANIQSALSTESAFSAISDLTPRALDPRQQSNKNSNGVGGGSSFRSAFALPCFFHGMSPVTTPAPSRAPSLVSALSRGGSRRTSIDHGNSGLLFGTDEDHSCSIGSVQLIGDKVSEMTVAGAVHGNGGDLWGAGGAPSPSTPALWEPQGTVPASNIQGLLPRVRKLKN